MVSGSPIKKCVNEETISLHHVVTNHGILTVTNKNGNSGFINNLRIASMMDQVKDKLNLIRWKCCCTSEDHTMHIFLGWLLLLESKMARMMLMGAEKSCKIG